MSDKRYPVRFRQIFVYAKKMYALDLSGNIWETSLSLNGHYLPVEQLRWVRASMPPDQETSNV
jgi:hypothetical protein